MAAPVVAPVQVTLPDTVAPVVVATPTTVESPVILPVVAPPVDPPKPLVATVSLDRNLPVAACSFDNAEATFTARYTGLSEPVAFSWLVDGQPVSGALSMNARLPGGDHTVALTMTGADGARQSTSETFTMPAPLRGFPTVDLQVNKQTLRAGDVVQVTVTLTPK